MISYLNLIDCVPCQFINLFIYVTVKKWNLIDCISYHIIESNIHIFFWYLIGCGPYDVMNYFNHNFKLKNYLNII